MDPAPETPKPQGNLFVATLLCGLCGGVLAATLSLLGVFDIARLKAHSWLEEMRLLPEEAHDLSPALELGLAIVVALLVSFFVLDSRALWRRLFLAACAIVLVVGTGFTASLLGYFFFPLTVLVGLIFAVVFALIYGAQHDMPCDMFVEVEGTPESSGQSKKVDVAKVRAPDIKKIQTEKRAATESDKDKVKKEEIGAKADPVPDLKSSKKNEASLPLPRVKKVEAANSQSFKVSKDK